MPQRTRRLQQPGPCSAVQGTIQLNRAESSDWSSDTTSISQRHPGGKGRPGGQARPWIMSPSCRTLSGADEGMQDNEPSSIQSSSHLWSPSPRGPLPPQELSWWGWQRKAGEAMRWGKHHEESEQWSRRELGRVAFQAAHCGQAWPSPDGYDVYPPSRREPSRPWDTPFPRLHPWLFRLSCV